MKWALKASAEMRGARPRAAAKQGKRRLLRVPAREPQRGISNRGFAMTYRAPVNEMLFMMRHVGELERAIDDGTYADLSLDVVENILQEAARFSAEVLAPINRAGDRHGAQLRDGAVTTAPGFKDAYQAWIGGGWNALAGPAAYGGADPPRLLQARRSGTWDRACAPLGH